MAGTDCDALPARRHHGRRRNAHAVFRIPCGALARSRDHVPACASRPNPEVRNQHAAVGGQDPRHEPQSPRNPVLPEFLAARIDRMVRGAGGAWFAGGAPSLETRGKGRSVFTCSRRYPARMVLPGAVLHPQTNTGARSGHRRGTSGTSGIWSVGAGMAPAPALGCGPERERAPEAGRGSWCGATGISDHDVTSGVLAMKVGLFAALWASSALVAG